MPFRVVIGEWPVLSISDSLSLSLSLSRLCLFLRLNGDLDKRVWAAREQLLNTKRQTKGGVGGQSGAESQDQIYRAICTLFQTPPAAAEVRVIYQTGEHGLRVQFGCHLKLISRVVSIIFLSDSFTCKGVSYEGQRGVGILWARLCFVKLIRKK